MMWTRGLETMAKTLLRFQGNNSCRTRTVAPHRQVKGTRENWDRDSGAARPSEKITKDVGLCLTFRRFWF